MLDWHKRQLKWFREVTGLSDYGVAWISFIKGVVIGMAIYHYFL